MKTLFPVILCLFLVSCASAKKKQCESQDWASYGSERADQGLPLEESYFEECKKEGVMPNDGLARSSFDSKLKAYCTDGRFVAIGKSGDPLQLAICPSTLHTSLQESYKKGVVAHCTQQGAIERGKSGKVNPKICDENFQPTYDQYFLKGKLSTLKIQIAAKEKRNLEITRRLALIPAEIGAEQAKLPGYQSLVDKKGKSNLETLDLLTTPNPQRKIDDLEKEQKSLNEEMTKISDELADQKLEAANIEAQIIQ